MRAMRRMARGAATPAAMAATLVFFLGSEVVGIAEVERPGSEVDVELADLLTTFSIIGKI